MEKIYKQFSFDNQNIDIKQGVHYKDRSKSKGDLRIYMDILGDFKDLNSIDFKYSASSLWTDSLELSSYNISIN